MSNKDIAQQFWDYAVHNPEGSERMRVFVSAMLKPMPSILDLLQMDCDSREQVIEQYKLCKADVAKKLNGVITGALRANT